MVYFASIVMAIILIVLGLVGIIAPEKLWYLQVGYKIKDSEPTDFALFMNRVEGIFCLGFAIFMLLFVFSS